MKKITFGIPEQHVPTRYCKNLCYTETDVKYDTSVMQFRETARGCLLEFPLEGDAEVFGFGLQLKGFNHKSHKLMLRTNSDPVAYTGDSHAPVPFFVTNKGYGMYFDTARNIEVYCGFTKKKNREGGAEDSAIATDTQELYKTRAAADTTVMSVDIPGAKGIDVYIFEGETITDIVSRYNLFSGGGCDVPEWGLGVLYRCYAKYTGDEVMATADYFRGKDIPCDVIGLEPGWQTHAYSCSYVWNPELYPEPQKVIDYLISKGYHINLWEHAFVNAASPIYQKMLDYSGDYEVWEGLVPDFATEKAQEIFADYHRDYLVKTGIDGFKLDECDSSDYVNDWSFPCCAQFPSGMDGEQYHNLFGVLYMQAVLKALGDTPTLSEVRNAGALSASYPFVLYSDLYDHKDFIRGTVNAGFSGILWTPEVRDAKSREEFLRRLQTVVFSVQCLINAWYLPERPWEYHGCEDEVRELLKERQKLLPMLKAAFETYRRTGKAPVRALVSDYTDDPETYAIDDAYLFCDNLLVAPMTEEDHDERQVYIPAGEWVDYWTKEPVESGWHTVHTSNIPVYEKR